MSLPDNRVATGVGQSPFLRWKKGYGVITHTPQTVVRVRDMVTYLTDHALLPQGSDPYELLSAADLVTSYAMWLVVHSSYAHHVYTDGRMLKKDDFKKEPEGHTGGSLNMTPGYVGYLTLNALTGKTRAWTMEQGHCVSAIDSVNVLVGNMKPVHASRYNVSDEGLSRFVQDFYSFTLTADGKQDSPRGSHVNHNTAGGVIEGGYLGFAGVQYVHMPLPHERLVAFLSDGAFEEQKGGDWAARFWRAEDSGLVVPIMIFNGRRIDQRSTMSQTGGAKWLAQYLRLQHFDPIIFDGRDPAAFVWAMFEMELRLKRYIKALESPNLYPIPLPYGIAVAPKGAGFYGEGTNEAHNLPLVSNPYLDELTRERFNYHAHRLWVDESSIKQAIEQLNNHHATSRIREKDHAIANRNVSITAEPLIEWQKISPDLTDEKNWTRESPITAIDKGFIAIVRANPQLRPRVGNPDEMRSNKMTETLSFLKFRAESPEGGNTESTSGAVITVLNEEAIAGAAFGNKGGINIIVTYEAFGTKIFGEARQEVIFSQHQIESGEPPQWLSVPIILATHVWENAKNEQSHQDPSMAEAMFGELSHISRVLFPPDYNCAAQVIHEVYKTHGQVWTIVVSKRNNLNLFTDAESRDLYEDGAIRLPWSEYEPDKAKIALIGCGSYQMHEVIVASARLRKENIPHRVICMLEPGKFRTPRSPEEAAFQASKKIQEHLLSSAVEHVSLVVHTRPEIIAGSIGGFVGARTLSQFGFLNHGGTLDTGGLLFANKSSWAHILKDAARVLNIDEEKLLTPQERESVEGKRSPQGVLW